MLYYMRRLALAIARRKEWLFVALFPPLVYLAVSAMNADRFLIWQDNTVSGGRQLSPAEVNSMLSAGPFSERADRVYPILAPTDRRTVSFQLVGGSTVRILYAGDNAENGSDLVAHYGARLKKALNPANGDAPSGGWVVSGQVVKEEHRSVWRDERARPAAEYFVLSLLLILLVMGAIELLDPSIKSERQAARYLGVPILGNVPDVEKVLHSMNRDHVQPGIAEHVEAKT